MIVSIENISKYYNGNLVLDNVSLTVENNDRIGIIGRNGCGKSTLLRILTGLELPDRESETGSVSVSGGASIGFLQQNSGLDNGNTIIEEMKSVFSKLLDAQKKMSELEKKMSETSDESITAEYTKLTSWFETNDGYLIDVKIKTVLNGMGFPQETYDKVISTLSGGEKTRLALSKLLLENPNLLILDEPTNHLDFATVMWLEDYLRSYKGALLIVSHDRYFLDRLCTSIAEIEFGKLTRYKGNYSAFVKLKEAAVIRQQKEYDMQQAEIRKLQDYVDRNLVRATTSSSAKSKRNALERMELIEKPREDTKKIKLDFEYDIVPPLDVLNVSNVDLTVGNGEKTLCENVSFTVRRGERVAFVGTNGAGKSTLLKVIQNKLPHRKGFIEWAKNTKISYFDQENAQLDMNTTVIDELHKRHRSMTEQEVRSALGRVRLTGENVFKKVGVISGGERAKLCFAIMIEERGNILILDEPTNHLDLVSKEELEDALSNFDQTILFVSHDRYLLNKLATRIIEIKDNSIEDFNCGFEEYLDIVRERQASEERSRESEKQKKAQEKAQKVYRTKEQRSADAAKKLKIKETEQLIIDAEDEISRLEAEIADPEVAKDYVLLDEKCKALENKKEVLSELELLWLELNE